VVIVVATGCGKGGGADTSAAPPAAAARTTEPAEVVVVPTVEPTTPPPTKKASAPAKKTPPKPKPKKVQPTTIPNWDEEPACATFKGSKITNAKAKAALTKASGKVYWETSAPKLKVPLKLVKAVSWMESGWQADITNCDGGYGLMQVMPETVSFVNNRFGTTYKVDNVQDNADLGANYLAWLTKYFGDMFYQGSYDLSAAKCRSHSDTCLLNLVVSAYNAGAGGVEASYPSKKLPNPGYVDAVRSLMKSCYCDRF
jgi:soluble lytic murein transglycosylase-like protein